MQFNAFRVEALERLHRNPVIVISFAVRLGRLRAGYVFVCLSAVTLILSSHKPSLFTLSRRVTASVHRIPRFRGSQPPHEGFHVRFDTGSIRVIHCASSFRIVGSSTPASIISRLYIPCPRAFCLSLLAIAARVRKAARRARPALHRLRGGHDAAGVAAAAAVQRRAFARNSVRRCRCDDSCGVHSVVS